jgi:copper homeostasis protein
MQFRLEICVDSVISAINAQEAGAHRIELCDNLGVGGTTPGPGKILSARNNLDIDVNVLIRPRGSDFLYSDIEYDLMRRDIEFCGEAGVNGVVIGILLKDGNIDIERTSKLVEHARPMSVTFHRAFDMCADPLKGLDDIIKTGADRLLTSGMKNRAADGIPLLKELEEQSKDRIIIMPGSGINENNIEEIARGSGAKEFHLTGRITVLSEMIYRKTDISMGGSANPDEYSMRIADILLIKNIIEILKMI